MAGLGRSAGHFPELLSNVVAKNNRLMHLGANSQKSAVYLGFWPQPVLSFKSLSLSLCRTE